MKEQYLQQPKMKQSASSKSERFRVQIRRKQREQMIRPNRKRDNIIDQIPKQGSLNQICEVTEMVMEGVDRSSITKLYDIVKGHANYMDALSEQSAAGIIKFIISEESMETDEGINLLSTFIQYTGFGKVDQKKKDNILRILKESHIQQIIFKQIDKNLKQDNPTRIKLLSNCLKYLAMNHIQQIRRKQLLQIYLPGLIEKYIDESSVMIFVSYVSEVYLFKQQIIKIVCQQCKSKHVIIKLSISSLLNNYIILENNLQVIGRLFQIILRTLSHIIVNNKGQSSSIIRNNLQTIIKLVNKYPQGRAQQLLTKISKCKFQELAIVMLTVCDESTKELIFQIEQSIIDKSIHELKQQFFLQFSLQILYHVAQGIQYTRAAIIERCLNMLIVIVRYAPQYIIKKIQCENLIYQALDNLCYHKNGRIVGLAQCLKPYFPMEGYYLESADFL